MITALVNKQIDASRVGDVDAYADTLLLDAGHFIETLKPEDRPILVLDELPFLILNAIDQAGPERQRAVIADVNRFLATLRAWRSRDVGVSMAFSGSFAMGWLRRAHGIRTEHMNDCIGVRVTELDRQQALAMFNAMVAHTPLPGWTEDSAAAVIDLLPSWFPGVLQLAFDQLRGAPCSPADIRDRHRTILEEVEEKYQSQFDSRFRRYSKQECQAARKLFAQIARQYPEPIEYESAAELLASPTDQWNADEVLEMLDEDGFVIATRSGGVAFASGLARAWYLGPKGRR